MAVFGFGRRNAVGRQYNGGNVSVMLPRYTTPPERNTRDWLEMFGRNPRLAVVDRIASDLSTCAGKLYRKDENGEEVEITDHPFLNFMAHPNPLYEMTWGACWRLQQIYLELKGEGYFVYEFDALGRPVELWPLPTHWVQQTPYVGYPYYEIRTTGGLIRQIPVDDIFCMKELNPLDPYKRGLGAAESLADEIETDEYAAKFQKKFFYNDATPTTLISMPGSNKDQRDRFRSEWNERFRGPFVRFSGFNRMTDRGVWAGLAEMIDPYEDTADAGAAGKTVVEEPEWDLIENELRAIDADGFRYSLHCQGDGAVRRTVALYASLPRDEHGRLLRRHAITDLENSDPTDLVEFGKLGGICEVYPQILTLDRREDCLSMMRRQIGETRLLHSWNRRGMEDSGCTVCCGTDLPLLIPSLGESIYSACGGYFDDGLPVNEANVLTLVELLRAWTAGGAYDLMREDELGTLEVGKLADICVLDRDVFDIDYRDARDLSVDMTMSDGQIVFDRNKEA